jgi:uncharacterized protein (DUF342 family)/DNA-binding response OmpR family regulator
MTKPARILLLEADHALAKTAIDTLKSQGWDVTWKTVSQEALMLLKTAKSPPFALFISCYQLPKMAGDDVLKEAKAISPLTQRMLLVPANQSDLAIRAINKADIHACLMTPASAQDLVGQVSSRLDAFRKTRKRQRLKGVTGHQNKQMFQIARKLKKKDKIFQEKISEKKAKILLLRSKLKAQEPNREPDGLDQRIQSLDIPITPQAFKKEFLSLADHILALFDSGAARGGLNREALSKITLTAPKPDQKDGQTADVPADMTGLMDMIIKAALASPASLADGTDGAKDPIVPEEDALEYGIKITISKDQTQAHARFTDPADGRTISLGDFLDLLRHKEISFGIQENDALEAWLKDPGSEPFCVAQGVAPLLGKDGSVTYHFETDYTNPGKIMEDGRIDFRDRGDIPFVNKGDTLATKKLPQQGKDGMCVTGEAIMVEEPQDPVFVAGNGARLSEDGTTIMADLDGQPHLDYLGEISVNPELPIKGDVDYNTGNINFKGHVVVDGTVKEGFTVTAFSLTAKEIQGATIDLTGDLHVSDGITDADIISSGNIYAKFINDSKVNAFGDLCIQKEIIDSSAVLSGKCDNSSGVIIASKISAKGGIAAGGIGTSTSKPALLKVGINEHLDLLTDQVEAKLQASVEKLADIRDEIRGVEDQDQGLYGRITEKAQIQEAAQNRLKALKQKIADKKKQGAAKDLPDLAAQYKAQEQTAKTAEQELNQIFDTQNQFAKQISEFKRLVTRLEETNKNLVLRKKGLKEFSEKTPSIPRVTVAKRIAQDTGITGPNASITIKEDRSRCQIMEKNISEEGLNFFEMEISDL